MNAADAAWSCGGGTENFLHHNCNRSGDLFRPEELTQVTVDAVAEFLRPIMRGKLIERHLSARRGTIGLLRTPDLRRMFPKKSDKAIS